MPQKLEPVRLELLALKSIGEWVKEVGRGLVEPVYIVSRRDPNQGLLFLHHSLSVVRETLFATVPWYLFDKMAEQILTSVTELINESKSSYDNFIPMAVFLNKMKVVVTLTEVVMHPHLRQLNVSSWPKIMRHVLNQNLYKLVGLEDLNLGSGSAGWDTAEAEKYILAGVQKMSNLTTFCLCFDCTNHIISALGNNCLSLQSLDVTSSRSITDRSIPSLLNCKKLREVRLYRTSITVAGYKDLLMGLPNIQDLGKCDEFGSVLEKLHEENSEPLSLTSLQCRDITILQLRLLIDYCPRLANVSIFHDERIADLTILSALHNLRQFKILNCDFFTDYVKELLETRGDKLESLHLEHVEEIDLNALIYISQFCPKLKTLIMYNCDFVQHAVLSFEMKKLAVPPFSCLERLVCVSECSLNHLEFLMMHCKNIRFIQLGSSTGINDATMSRILSQNQMKMLEELKILYSHDLSMHTVHLLMNHCDKLHTLSELECWDGITESELNVFRENLRKSNINLDITPTLSHQ